MNTMEFCYFLSTALSIIWCRSPSCDRPLCTSPASSFYFVPEIPCHLSVSLLLSDSYLGCCFLLPWLFPSHALIFSSGLFHIEQSFLKLHGWCHVPFLCHTWCVYLILSWLLVVSLHFRSFSLTRLWSPSSS